MKPLNPTLNLNDIIVHCCLWYVIVTKVLVFSACYKREFRSRHPYKGKNLSMDSMAGSDRAKHAS